MNTRPARLSPPTVLLLAAVALAAATPAATPPAPATWAGDIAPLVYHSCAECHRPGGPGPFSLLTYPQVRKRARQIALVTESRFMPPWLPEPDSGPFVHNRRLPDAQIALLRRWVAAGAPPGDLAAAPPPPRFPAGWRLGPPDRVVTPLRSYTLPGETTGPYRCLVLPLGLTQDKWLRAIDLRPGNAAVVRQAVLFADATGTARRLEAQSGAVGYTARDAGLGADAVRLAEWGVAAAPWVLPAGAAERLPAGSDLVLLLRLEPDGQKEDVRPSLGLYYAPSPPAAPVTLTLGARDLILQPDQRATLTDTFTLPVAARLLRVTPHAHPVCRTLQVTAIPTTGPARTLLTIHDWNADWQDSYLFADPPTLPAGTRLTLRWEADDSADNPRNPSVPPMTVLPGLLYLDDMATVRLQLLPAAPADAPALDRAIAAARPPPTVQATPPRRHG